MTISKSGLNAVKKLLIPLVNLSVVTVIMYSTTWLMKRAMLVIRMVVLDVLQNVKLSMGLSVSKMSLIIHLTRLILVFAKQLQVHPESMMILQDWKWYLIMILILNLSSFSKEIARMRLLKRRSFDLVKILIVALRKKILRFFP